jgi:hypothetical protein
MEITVDGVQFSIEYTHFHVPYINDMPPPPGMLTAVYCPMDEMWEYQTLKVGCSVQLPFEYIREPIKVIGIKPLKIKRMFETFSQCHVELTLCRNINVDRYVELNIHTLTLALPLIEELNGDFIESLNDITLKIDNMKWFVVNPLLKTKVHHLIFDGSLFLQKDNTLGIPILSMKMLKHPLPDDVTELHISAWDNSQLSFLPHTKVKKLHLNCGSLLKKDIRSIASCGVEYLKLDSHETIEENMMEGWCSALTHIPNFVLVCYDRVWIGKKYGEPRITARIVRYTIN